MQQNTELENVTREMHSIESQNMAYNRRTNWGKRASADDTAENDARLARWDSLKARRDELKAAKR